jgi:CHAT domain-containing protein
LFHCRQPEHCHDGEVIHISAAFQIARFPHVIGTIWKVDDDTTGQVSRQFYQRLMAKTTEKGKSTREDIRRAFHESCLAVCEEDPEDYLAWAAFIHFGI